jgi:hypothetical protein
MPFSIDHIVVASDDLDAAIVNARAAGFTVVPGGVHGSGNTHNALIGLADGAYLELFAPTPQGRSAEHRWFGRIRNGGGLVDFCLLGAGLGTEIARIGARGIDYSQPFAMARVTPRGARIEWLLSTPPGATGQNGWPFMIEDTTPRAIRVPHAPGQIRHANGAQGVAGITVLVRDVDASSMAYEAILGTKPQPIANTHDAADRTFSVAGAWIKLRNPRSAEENAHLECHGQGPYQITLRTHEGPVGPEAGSMIDPALFSGARIALV